MKYMKSNSNNTEIDDMSLVISPKKEEREDITPSNQQESINLVCNENKHIFSPNSVIVLHKQSKHEA